MILKFQDFVNELLQAGFSTGGGSNESVYSIVPWSWNEEPPYPTPVIWHTGDPETDPWEWRMRVVEERKDIAYGKFFSKKSGFITREWMPLFLAVRQSELSFNDAYHDGKFSQMAKRLYTLIEEQESVAYHDMKTLLNVSKTDEREFERALLELQGKLYITISGRQQKRNASGELYGWSSTVFSTVEQFFGPEILSEAKDWDRDQAIQSIEKQILKLNPKAETKKIQKFICG